MRAQHVTALDTAPNHTAAVQQILVLVKRSSSEHIIEILTARSPSALPSRVRLKNVPCTDRWITTVDVEDWSTAFESEVYSSPFCMTALPASMQVKKIFI